MQLMQLIEDTCLNGGATQWADNEPRTTGYSVGNNNTSLVLDLTGATSMVQAMMSELNNINRWATDTSLQADGIRAWLDGNTVYFDHVTHIDNLPDALALARTNKELAIYDIALGLCINTAEEF